MRPPSVCLLLPLIALVSSQSNYADQANSIGYQGEGLPPEATLDGKVTKLDDLSPVIFLNRTKAALNCAAGSMLVELKFNDAFHGIAYADFDRNSACQVTGKGSHSYKLELPLKGCGTKQEPQRVFTNNIVVRFHPNLEMDGDEIITIVCRYPPPVAPVPPIPLPIKEAAAPVAALEPPLKGFQILLIICGILFLSLMLLGLGCSYYCLRRRPVAIIRPFSSIGSDSEITKLSGSSLGTLSMFEGLKIPRAHAPVAITGSSSGSEEGNLISDTLPSDYPSESHSEVEETRSLPVSSAGSFENRAFIQDNGSFFGSEGYGHTQEQQVQNASFTSSSEMVSRFPIAVKGEPPNFDVQVRVKRAPPSPPSLSFSDTESMRTERNLSTIPEQLEDMSIRSVSPPITERTHFTYVPELHPPPKHIQPAPTFNRILRKQQEMADARSIASLNTEMTDTHSITETLDDSHHMFIAPVPPPPPPIVPKQNYMVQMERPGKLEPPITPMHKPEITSHVVDDVFLRTITEKKTFEDIERHRRLITEFHARPKQPPVAPIEDTKWNVTIKNYPVQAEPPDWENFSDISSASGMTLTPKLERASLSLPPQPQIDDNKLPLNAPELVSNIGPRTTRRMVTSEFSNIHRDSLHAADESEETFLSTFNVPLENPAVPNWNVLIRVLQPTEQEEEGPVIESAETFNSQLTLSDKMKWRQIITTESTLRTLLTEAVVKEDFETIRKDQRYEKIFEPPKWDVIIRILTPIDRQPKSRFRKKSDWDNRSRRSSLPTLYEYDSDGGSSVKTLTRDSMVYPAMPQRSSRSSCKSEADLRSMSEMTVDFGRPDHFDTQSEASSYYPDRQYYEDSEVDAGSTHGRSLARSLSQPSLARSASEFTERWVAPSRYDTASEFTSPEGTPKSQRSTRMQHYHLPASDQQSSWQASESRRTTRGPAATTEQVTREFRSEAKTSFMGPPRKGWFGDNESEASYK
ncbi:uncharacterized protein LOC109538775 [Dendroctonus ponderosae]|uniref:ZP domain-containing protein n=1 Tax=Dendroctonus ponderosae TaxID=77166 RepID=A0AAR5PL00_DENPD|nr:uncharacterized protein LOC109538775 [Dendroctonus ponderosae]XP_048526103.1 uncharacterized protein LOC109538775 [Dendroctonus ponderosae]